MNGQQEDMNRRVQQYVALRDALKLLDDEHDLARKEFVESMDVLQGRIRSFMEANKLENLKTAHGTCYRSTRYTASLADADAFMKHVIETKEYELLDRRANANAVKAYVEKHNGLPPGVNLNSIQTVGVRRASGT